MTHPTPSPMTQENTMSFTHVELVDILMKFGMPNLDAQICAREIRTRTPGSDGVGDDCVNCNATESALNHTINERDAAEEAMSQSYYLVTGKSPEWSNLFGYEEALEEIKDAQELMRKSIKQAPTPEPVGVRKFNLGDRVEKIKGSAWHGVVVGFYSTELTPIGYAVESEREPGSVQIYPEAALSQTKR